MDRITVKLGRDTHSRLMAALPELSTEVGRMLTVTEAIEHLLASHHASPYASPGVPANWARLQQGQADAKA